MRSLARVATYFAVAVGAVVSVSVGVALSFDYDVRETVSIGLIAAGAAVAALGALTAAGPPPPDMPGLEREYLRHVHHRHAAERRAWQNENFLLNLGGAGLAAAGTAVTLLS